MTEPESESTAALRDRAIAGVEDLVAVAAAGRSVGIAVPDADEIRAHLRLVGDVDPAGLAADAHRLAGVHRVVAETLQRLPEQQIRLDHGWASAAGTVVHDVVVEHRRRAEADLHALRTMTEATTAAASGIDQILRTWYRTLARLCQPLLAGVALPELPVAVVTGRVPLPVIAADIAARIDLLVGSAEMTRSGIDAVVATLVHTTQSWEAVPEPGVPYPGDPMGANTLRADTAPADVFRADPSVVPDTADPAATPAPGPGSPDVTKQASVPPVAGAPADVPLTLSATGSDQPGSDQPGSDQVTPDRPEADLALAGDQ